MTALQEQAHDTDPATARAGQLTTENESIDVNRISPTTGHIMFFLCATGC